MSAARIKIQDVRPVLAVGDTDVDMGTFGKVENLSRSERADALTMLAAKYNGTANVPAAIVARVAAATRTTYRWLAVSSSETDISDTDIADLLGEGTLTDDHRGVFVHGTSVLPTDVTFSAPGLLPGGSVVVALATLDIDREGRRKQADGTWKGTGVFTTRTVAHADYPFTSVAGKPLTLSIVVAPRPTGLKVTARLV